MPRVKNGLAFWPLGLTIGVLSGFALASGARYVDTHSRTRVVLASAVIVLLLALVACLFRLRSREWFHPSAFPLTYLSLTLMLPVLYLVGTLRPIGGIQPGHVSPSLVTLFLLTVSGTGAGIGASMALTHRTESTRPAPLNYAGILRAGRWMIALGIMWRVSELPAILQLPYGYGSAIYSLRSAILTIVNGLFFIGVILIVLAHSQRGQTILNKADLALVGAFSVLTLATGSRGSLVAPALFLLWGYHTYQRKISLWRGLAVAALIVTIFATVGIYRSDDELRLETEELASPALSPISTPVLITSNLLERVPSRYPFEQGATYLAALQRQLPGPISRVVFGPPQQTGTFVYRRIINFTDPNAGFAFSIPSEAYLNFGFPGAFVVGVLLGCLLGYAYRKHEAVVARPIHLLYPILISTLPLSLRSDAVFQVKSVLYALIALTIVYRLGRKRSEVPRRVLITT